MQVVHNVNDVMSIIIISNKNDLIKHMSLFFLVDCKVLPPCPYSAASCVAVNVPLECPGLCGLCDRYEVLKRVYGENNLAPNTFRTKPLLTTTIR